jgi:hypothetical protein
MKQLYCKTPAEWREWLHNNHDDTSAVWLIFFKKHSGKPSIEYEAAVEEALCFGWIDSIIKRIDCACEPILAETHKKRVYRAQGWISAVVLVDGHMAGIWEYDRQPSQTVERLEIS